MLDQFVCGANPFVGKHRDVLKRYMFDDPETIEDSCWIEGEVMPQSILSKKRVDLNPRK